MQSAVRPIPGKPSFFVLLFLIIFVMAYPSSASSGEQEDGVSVQEPAAPRNEFKRFEFVVEPDAYYSDIDLIIALSSAPIPHLGERTESEIYGTLLSRAAILPRFLVLEASVNPMPLLGVYVKEHNAPFYNEAQESDSFNWVKALTAGFEEPYAFSLLAGNVVNFDVAGSANIKGNGYSGYLFSTGNYHIKDNELVHDRWYEFEWKMKGDRRSPIKKMSWSYRIGAKLHENHFITDILYLSIRRSRLDYKPEGPSLLNNSGFEYTIDMNRQTFDPVRHYFYVDKKWPFENHKAAFALAAGFVWESAEKYTGPLAEGRNTSNFQIILRPNVEF